MQLRNRPIGTGRTMAVAAALAATLTLSGCASTFTGGSDDAAPATAAAETTAATGTTASTAAAQAPASDTSAPSGIASGRIANLPAGWNVIAGPKASMGAPIKWLDLRPLVTDPAARAAFEQSVKDQSTSAVIDSIAPELLDQIDLMAIDGTTSATGFATTLNVIVDGTSLVPDLDTMDTLIASQLAAVGGELQTSSRATLGGTDTLVVDYSISTAQNVTATGRQYYQDVNDSIVTVTFTALADQVDYALWDQMTSTLTLNA